jgi:TATA-binding protein-associated factor Taf7
MVKINDPRQDTSGIAMRVIRAKKAYKYIQKVVQKSVQKGRNDKVFKEEKFKFEKYDTLFSEDFKECHENIKQELVFLWEEIGDLNEIIESYESTLSEYENKSNASNGSNKGNASSNENNENSNASSNENNESPDNELNINRLQQRTMNDYVSLSVQNTDGVPPPPSDDC